MARININGTHYDGDNISIQNGELFVNGEKVSTGETKEIYITVEGDVGDVNIAHCKQLIVHGIVEGDVDLVSGDVTVKRDVLGDVETVSGNVKCERIAGNVETVSGNITQKQ